MGDAEDLIEWYCYYCNVFIGKHPRGVRIKCPACKKEQILPGADLHGKKTWDEVAEIEERARQEALKKYQAMRER